ncbi:MAG TPA: hypothetical protein VF834_21160 [Streptosporangiaceae bacterium]
MASTEPPDTADEDGAHDGASVAYTFVWSGQDGDRTYPPELPARVREMLDHLRERPGPRDGDREAIRRALRPLLRDMRASGAIVLDYREEHWSEIQGSPAEQVVQLAERLQEWEIEELWTAGRQTSWPECPDHPASHPLDPDLNDSDLAVWRCPRTRREICPIGQLGSPDAGGAVLRACGSMNPAWAPARRRCELGSIFPRTGRCRRRSGSKLESWTPHITFIPLTTRRRHVDVS